MAACHLCKGTTNRYSHGLDRELKVTVVEDVVVICRKCKELIEAIVRGRVHDDSSD